MKRRPLRTAVITALGVSTLVVAANANAGASASLTASSMYLWRGITLSGAGPAISGDLYYTADFGLYGGIWTSSEGVSGSHETDLNVGFSKKFGDIGFDVGVYEYLYPENGGEKTDIKDTDAHEWYVGGTFGPVGVKLLQNTQNPDGRYFTIDGMFGKFGAHIGITKTGDSSTEYKDFNVSYMPADNLTFTMSIARGNGVEGDDAAGVVSQEDPLFVVSYKWPFEVK